MPTGIVAKMSTALLLVTGFVTLAGARMSVSFEDRVRAQETIARVAYSHQIGATKSFEEAVPRSEIERQVREYMEQSQAWEAQHNTSITKAMLSAEWDRIEGATQMPDRLRELVSALGGIESYSRKCVARASLGERPEGDRPRGQFCHLDTGALRRAGCLCRASRHP
jgi:hypothetical protein